MRLPPYPKYEPTGEAWVPKLPDSWELVRLRWLSTRYAGGTPDKSNNAFWDEGDIPWLNSGAVNDGYITEPSEYITREGFLGSSAKWIPKGALVLALAGQGKTKGMVAQLGFAATCNQSMAAIIPTHRIRAGYLYWWLTANYFNIRNMAGGEARDGLNLDLLGSIPCPVPDGDAQRAIAVFLDRETAKIDTLVANKWTLIERLKEKRTALISRTVTHGLPPDAARAAGLAPHPMIKSSGIAWLGQVPERWNVQPLKRAVRFLEGPGIMASDFVDEGVPLLRIASITGPRVTLEGCNYLLPERVAEQWAHFRVCRGDLLISGSASTGFCSEVDETAEGAVPYTGIIIIRPFENVVEKAFVRWFFLSKSFLLQAELARSGSTIQHFGPSHLSRMIVVVPPLVEQRGLAAFLDRETANIDRMVAKVETAIERLHEYRTALITAAVTGTVDVRGIAA